jgi:hypothetical protein
MQMVGQLQQLAKQPLKGLRVLRVDRGVLVAAAAAAVEC